MVDAELKEMWHVALGVSQCVCVALLPTVIGMYAFLGTRSTRYYQGLARTFKIFPFPSWISPILYMSWMAVAGFTFWLIAFSVDCTSGKYGFDLNPFTNLFFVLWTIPMGLRLFFFSGRQWRGLLFTTDVVALALAIAYYIMQAVNMPEQPLLACNALIPKIIPLTKTAKAFFFVFWGTTVFWIFLTTIRDLMILMKPAQSFKPVDDWMDLWYRSEAECTEFCQKLTSCQLRALEPKYPGITDAYNLLRDAQRAERVASIAGNPTIPPSPANSSTSAEPSDLLAGTENDDDDENAALVVDENPVEADLGASWMARAVKRAKND